MLNLAMKLTEFNSKNIITTAQHDGGIVMVNSFYYFIFYLKRTLNMFPLFLKLTLFIFKLTRFIYKLKSIFLNFTSF